MTTNELETAIRESIATKQRLLDQCLGQIEALNQAAMDALSGGGKLLLSGCKNATAFPRVLQF